MNYKTTQEMAKLWKVKPIEITYLLRKNKIPGAKKEGKYWYIPENTPKPLDGRCKDDKLELLSLPIGIDKFKEIVNSHYYVDKTLMIKDIIDDNYKIYLFTRPRRFGKSLNMDMLKTFFEKNEVNPYTYFKYTNIGYAGKKYESYMGIYPVINLTFKDVRGTTWEELFYNLKDCISQEFNRHKYLLNESLIECDKERFYNFMAMKATDQEYVSSIEFLSRLCDEYYHKAPIIIIDEYDTPVNDGYMYHYYDKIINFLRAFFSKALKGNEHLTYGFLTGINRIAKESIFSGLNNIKEYTIFNNRYSEYFGFTHNEVKEMLNYYQLNDRYEEVCRWYDGYNFGGHNIFNPWSIINYVAEKGIADTYWVNTSSNDIIKNIIKEASSETKSTLVSLLEGKTIPIKANLALVYQNLKYNSEAIFTLLLNAGYLRAMSIDSINHNFCEVMIPNKEVRCIYEEEILDTYTIKNITNISYNIRQAMYIHDMVAFESYLKEYMINAISYFDTSHEDFYQGLLLGLYASLTSDYYILSNREAGHGRYDISLEPKESYNTERLLHGMIIELKVLSKPSTKDIKKELKELSQKALEQIKTENYAQSMEYKGLHVLKMGIAFYKKEVAISQDI